MLESRIQKNILESHLLGLGIRTNEIDSIQKSNSHLNAKASEIDDDIFKLPEKISINKKASNDDDSESENSNDDETTHLIQSENKIDSINFNTYFSQKQTFDADSFFEVTILKECIVTRLN